MADNRNPIPEHIYRWIIVGASAVMLAIAVGFISTGITAFIIPLNIAFDWPRGAVSFINSTGIIGVALGGIAMGRLADKTSTRLVALIGAVSFGTILLLAAKADALWQFYALFFLAGFLGAGAMFTPLVTNVGNWFSRNVGFAIGIVSAGQALGQGGLPFASALLVGRMGWNGALSFLGVVSLIIMLPLALLITKPPRPAYQIAQGAVAVEEELSSLISPTIVTVWLSAAVIFCCITMSVPLMHLVPLAQDRGFELDDAAGILFAMLLAGVVGRVAFGRLADLIGPVLSYLVASGWQTVLVFFFLQLETLSGFYIYAVIYGFGYSGVMTSILVCVRMLTPISRRAFALGIITMFAWIGHGIGGYQGGFFFDLTGSYNLSYANAVLTGIVNLMLIGVLCVTLNRRRTTLAMT